MKPAKRSGEYLELWERGCRGIETITSDKLHNFCFALNEENEKGNPCKYCWGSCSTEAEAKRRF
jgi:hypothetical protein